MSLVRGSGFRSLSREVAGGADLQKVYWVPLEQTSEAGVLLIVKCVLVSVYPRPRQQCR